MVLEQSPGHSRQSGSTVKPVVIGVLVGMGGIAFVLYILCVAFVWEGTNQEGNRGLTRLRYAILAPITLLDWYLEERKRRKDVRRSLQPPE